MARFEVHIPAPDRSGLNVTFRVDADNWMAALKTGLAKLGEQGLAVHNVLVDVQSDNSLHVTEASSGRVFRIRELTEQEAARAEVKRMRPAVSNYQPQTGSTAKTIISGPPAGMQATPGAPAVIGTSGQPAPASDAVTQLNAPNLPPSPLAMQPERTLPSAAPAPQHVTNEPAAVDQALSAPREAPGQAPAFGASALSSGPSAEGVAAAVISPLSTGRPAPGRGGKKSHISAIVELEKPVVPVAGPIGRSRASARSAKERLEDVLEDVFDRVSAVHRLRSAEEGLYFLLDLALEKIPAESGTAFLADAGTGDLRFSAVRGPKAPDILRAKPVVPAGSGIVGFCAVEGVSVALSDVEKDPRHYAAIAEKVDYEIKSVLCSPVMTHGRAFGALELINKRDDSLFNEYELGLLAYVAHQAALFLNNLG